MSQRDREDQEKKADPAMIRNRKGRNRASELVRPKNLLFLLPLALFHLLVHEMMKLNGIPYLLLLLPVTVLLINAQYFWYRSRAERKAQKKGLSNISEENISTNVK